MAYDVEELISTAQKRLEQAKSFDAHNREEAENDLLFRVLKQWDESVLTDRSKSDPPRPCLTVDRLGAFCNQVVNEMIQSEPSPMVAPRGGGANKKTSQVIEGKVRATLYDSDAQLGFMEASKYAVISGTGHFRLDPEMVNEETNQQRLVVNPIFDPSTVYTDPFAKKPDKSDARWRLVVNVMSRIEYTERWPKAQANGTDFFDKDRQSSLWMDPNGDRECVMVAEYWCVEKIGSDNVALDNWDDDKVWADGKTYPKPAARDYPEGQTHRVVCHYIDGVEELEPPAERPGKIIPIFTVEGDSFWVKGKRYVMSLIRSPRDNQRLYNWEATKEVELLAMASTAPYLVTPKMVQNHEAQWQNAPNQNYFYLKFNADPDAGGVPIPRGNVNAPIEAISAAKATTAQEMKDQIGLQDPNLGRAQSANQSGIAIQKLRSEGDLGTYHYQNNLKRTLKTFCKVLVSWLPHYHDIEEDMLILDGEMQEKTVKVNTAVPYTDPETNETYQHDLTKGSYEVVAVDIGPSYATAREEEADFYSGIISAVPDAFWVMGDMLLRARDSVGSQEAADRIKRAIALKTPGLIQDDPSQLPPAASAQIQAMQAQIQQMGQQLQQQAVALKMQIAPKQIEAQSRVQTENIKAKASITKTLMELTADLQKAKMEHGHAMYETQIDAALTAVQNLSKMLHESELAPGPDAGSLGLHPSMPPQPMGANGAPAGTPPY
jgi:hypothetical protein